MLAIGPNSSGLNVTDFTDLNGTYVNSGNPMNQDQDLVNGENPGDRFVTAFAVNASDDGRFVTAGYADFTGLFPNGRLPDQNGFINLISTVEPARLNSMRLAAADLVGSQEEVNHLVGDLYQPRTCAARRRRRTWRPTAGG